MSNACTMLCSSRGGRTKGRRLLLLLVIDVVDDNPDTGMALLPFSRGGSRGTYHTAWRRWPLQCNTPEEARRWTFDVAAEPRFACQAISVRPCRALPPGMKPREIRPRGWTNASRESRVVGAVSRSQVRPLLFRPGVAVRVSVSGSFDRGRHCIVTPFQHTLLQVADQSSRAFPTPHLRIVTGIKLRLQCAGV